MFRIPLAPLHAALVALSRLRDEEVDGDRFTFDLDPSRSLVECTVSTALGASRLEMSAGAELSGSMQLALHPGTFPDSRGQELGGRVACDGRLCGSLPEPASGRPARLHLALDALVIEPHSQPFVADGHGHFLHGSSLTIRSGKLLLRPIEGGVVVLPLSGITSREVRAQGAVWIDADGIHLARELAISFQVHAPELGLELQIEIRGILRGDMALPLARAAAASGAADELPEELEYVVETELEPEAPQLLVTQGSPSTLGLILLQTFGLRAASAAEEAPLRTVQGLFLHLLGVERRCADALVIEIPVPSLARLLLPGPGWSLQLGYRDPPLRLTS